MRACARHKLEPLPNPVVLSNILSEVSLALAVTQQDVHCKLWHNNFTCSARSVRVEARMLCQRAYLIPDMAARNYSQEGAKMKLFEAARHQTRSLTPLKGRRARITCDYCQRRKCMLFKGKEETRSRLNIALKIIEHTLRTNPGPSPLSSSLRAQLRGFRTISSTHARLSALRRRTRSVPKELMGADDSEEEYEEKPIPPPTMDAENTTSCGCSSLPPFIRPPPKHLDNSDYEYLSRKDAFLVPGG
ncbi:hypothetical protein BDV06DRAFT_228321 [Aspergillus oleicola]